ncbi:DUF397 domain-containing protein [Actinophytocola sp.]|uniref:DUF397 domain-containing protein n=1 Tax=Actinophytocola sp. TaxID=1872138 RepID=UPI002D80D40F|nr:DUF397 domain-containing protein [Actinophytocola sp.]HET9142299.1 DUF397 domain-containing protein [Actinophytocola sp.]HEU5111019.1 DUF397 domain-containing protein [Micromonosporaceae bacterium]
MCAPVPPGVVWRKSSHSNGDGNVCVEIAFLASGAMAIRDSKNPPGGVLMLPARAWDRFRRALGDH